MSVKLLHGDCREVLRTLPDASVHCCVTSPPYFGLRDYGVEGQIGLEDTPAAFTEAMVAVFREVRRVLRDDGTLWLNLGDSYASGGRKTRDPGQSKLHPAFTGDHNATTIFRPDDGGAKPKDLLGIPWRVAFALQADGWYLRQDIIWHKPNPMPESVRDRCTKAHEYLFLLAKSERYYFDSEAMQEPAVAADIGAMDGGAQRNPDGSNANAGRNFRAPGNIRPPKGQAAYESGDEMRRTKAGLLAYSFRRKTATTPPPGQPTQHREDREDVQYAGTRNKRSVWTVATVPYSGAHFATFPPALIDPCINAGCPEGGTVLDPFGGAGTTGLVADRLQRSAILIELNPAYAALAAERISGDAPLFAEVSA